MKSKANNLSYQIRGTRGWKRESLTLAQEPCVQGRRWQRSRAGEAAVEELCMGDGWRKRKIGESGGV
jgi:hypothetical protein